MKFVHKIEIWTDWWRLTLDSVAVGIYTKGNGNEQGKYFLRGTRRPAHQARHIEQRVEDQEEGRPQADAAVHGVKVQVEILANVVDDCGSAMNRSGHPPITSNFQLPLM